MSRYRLALTTLIAGLVLLSCGGAQAFSVKQELQLGKDSAAQVEKEMPPSDNTKWQSDIEALGKKLVPFVKRKELTYHFKVLKEKEQINAFALPGGYVYFTERMWRIMTPDERAGIMAHEITHCDHRHGVNMMLKQQQRMLWMLPLIVLGGPDIANAAMWGNLVINQRYSRDMEREADQDGMKLLTAAGFNPGGAVTSMKKLLNIESTENKYEISSIFASHPDTLVRVQYLTQEAERLGAKPGDLELKAVDDPSRLGNISSTRPDVNLVTARTRVPLVYGQKVLIKKMLWDDDAQALKPKTVSSATVLTPGVFPILAITKNDDFSLAEIMEGDGVYPDEPAPEQPIPAKAP